MKMLYEKDTNIDLIKSKKIAIKHLDFLKPYMTKEEFAEIVGFENITPGNEKKKY